MNSEGERRVLEKFARGDFFTQEHLLAVPLSPPVYLPHSSYTKHRLRGEENF